MLWDDETPPSKGGGHAFLPILSSTLWICHQQWWPKKGHWEWEMMPSLSLRPLRDNLECSRDTMEGQAQLPHTPGYEQCGGGTALLPWVALHTRQKADESVTVSGDSNPADAIEAERRRAWSGQWAGRRGEGPRTEQEEWSHGLIHHKCPSLPDGAQAQPRRTRSPRLSVHTRESLSREANEDSNQRGLLQSHRHPLPR